MGSVIVAQKLSRTPDAINVAYYYEGYWWYIQITAGEFRLLEKRKNIKDDWGLDYAVVKKWENVKTKEAFRVNADKISVPFKPLYGRDLLYINKDLEKEDPCVILKVEALVYTSSGLFSKVQGIKNSQT